MGIASRSRTAVLRARSSLGTPAFVSKNRDSDDYSLHRAGVMEHLGALDMVYARLISDNRQAIKDLDEIDLVSQDLVIGQNEQLEKYHWFVRAHLEDDAGYLSTGGARTLREAADAAEAGATR